MNVITRRKIEAKIVRKLVRTIIEAGYLITVDTVGGEISYSNNYRKIMKNIFATDTVEVLLSRDVEGEQHGWILLVYGNDGFDVIADYTINLEELLKPVNDLASKLEKEYF